MEHASTSSITVDSPDTVEHRLLFGGRLGDGPFGAHHLARVLLFASFTVLVLVGFGRAVLSQDLRRGHFCLFTG